MLKISEVFTTVVSSWIAPTGIYLVTLLMLLADAYNSDSTISKFLGLSSRSFAVIAVFLLIFIRAKGTQAIHEYVRKLNVFIVIPLSFIVGIYLTIWTYQSPLNYVFSIIPIQHLQVLILCIFAISVAIIFKPYDWLQKHYHVVIFIASLILLSGSYIASIQSHDLLMNITREDHFVENLQFYVLLFAAFFSVYITRKLFVTDRIHGYVFMLISIILFAVAGDEISWGQRIFEYTAPEAISIHNDQREMTIHNMSFFSGFVGIGYTVTGFYGSFAWILGRWIKQLQKAPLSYYIPAWSSALFFFGGFYYNYYNLTVMYHSYSAWAEVAELMLYAGVLAWTVALSVSLSLKTLRLRQKS